MIKIINPEKECGKTPEKFSGESQVISLEREDYRSGIVLDSPKEFADALRVYGGALVIEGSRATQDNLRGAIGNTGEGLGAILLDTYGSMSAEGFVERLAKEASLELQSNGRFHRSFDYDAMGTQFFKTTVKGRKVGDKYVLELCAAYVGNEPENKLAETLEKPRALLRSSINGKLSIVDDWWFNVDLEKVLASLPDEISMSPKKIKHSAEQWAQNIVSGGYEGASPEFEIEHEGRKLSLSFGLDVTRYLRPEGTQHGEEYLQARGSSVVGGAWTTWDENGSEVAPIPENPSVIYSVSIPGERYTQPCAVTEEEMKSVQSARNYLQGIIQEHQ